MIESIMSRRLRLKGMLERLLRRAVIFLPAMLIACSEDAPNEPGGDDSSKPAPVVRTSIVMGGPGGRKLVAADTLVSQVIVTPAGSDTARIVRLVHQLPDRFRFLSFSSNMGSPVLSTGEVFVPFVDVPPGDSLLLELKLLVPEFYPDGQPVYGDITVEVDHDDDGGTAPVVVADSAKVLSFNDSGPTFELLAPGVPAVYISGGFNGWDLQERYRLFPDRQEKWFRLSGNPSGIPGHPVSFRFVLSTPGENDAMLIADPRARVVFQGETSVYDAGLFAEPFVSGQLPGGVTPSRLIIYQICVDNIGEPDGQIRSILPEHLRLVDLGINAVEILPAMTPIDRHASLGFESYSLFSRDWATAELLDIGDFIESAHSDNIAVFFTINLDRTKNDGPIAKIDAFSDGESGLIKNRRGDDPDYPEFNWDNEDMRDYFLDACLFWIEQYGVDGFRFEGVEAADYGGYRWLVQEIKSRYPNTFLIADDLSFPPFSAVTSSGMDAQWGGQNESPWGGTANNFQNVMMALLREDRYSGRIWEPARGSWETSENPMWALADVLGPNPGFPTAWNEIKYVVNYREQRVVGEVDRNGTLRAREVGGLTKARLAAATLLTAVGIPMIFMGEEIGEDDYYFPSPHPVVDVVDWNEGDYDLRDYYKELIRLRLNHPTLAGGGIRFHGEEWGVDQGVSQQRKTIVYWRYLGSEAETDIVVAANFNHFNENVLVEFPESGTWWRFGPDGTYTEIFQISGAPRVEIPRASAYIYFREDPR